ncbi:MAG: SDR family oxidoreductase [Candidatus Dormibacteraeota bacterium]|nr:SDR family oxidoreductase [Candidatus Dormibacteraeota bacterium]
MLGDGLAGVAADVTRPSEVIRLFETAADESGRIDILINNAGLVIKKRLAETTDEDYERAFAVNARAPFLTMREASRRIEDGGRIVNVVTSILAFTIPHHSVYAGSKGAVEHFSKALAKELGQRGVTVNCVAPGPLDTPFYYPVETDESIAGAKSRSIGNRLAEIQDVVPLIGFLLPARERLDHCANGSRERRHGVGRAPGAQLLKADVQERVPCVRLTNTGHA